MMRDIELEILKRHLYNSNYCVCLLGKGLDYESGIANIRDDDDSYEIEDKYGYSLEEIFSYSFLSTKPEKMFSVIHEKVIPQLDCEPGASYKALKELEDKGLVKHMITRSPYGMAKKCGCKNVIEMRGNFTTLRCTRCRHTADVREAVAGDGKAPICPVCSGSYRPDMTLFGEMVPIDVITEATQEISKADLLLVLASGLHSTLCNNMVKYFSGSNLILIHENKEVADSKAELVIYERPENVLPLLLQ